MNPKKARKPGNTVIHAVRYFSGAVITFAFPYVSRSSPAGIAYVFVFHAAYMALVLLVIILLVPETKGLSETEVANALREKVPWLIPAAEEQDEVGSPGVRSPSRASIENAKAAFDEQGDAGSQQPPRTA